ncbi:MAG: YncE family protein [Thermodesulfobacteriota bacterium]
MRLLKTLPIFGFLGLALWGCDGGGRDGQGEQFFALTNSPEVVVGGLKGSVDGGVTVLVRNLDTGEERETTASNEGSFIVTLEGAIGDTIGISAPGVDVAVEVINVSDVSPEIRQEIMSGAVRRNLAQLGSVPTTIEIRGSRAYVLNGFSDNIQIFNLDQDPPQQIGTIVLPPGSDPVAIAFLDDTRAYIANFIGQSVALVNVESRECEVIIAREGGDFAPCQEVIVEPGAFEEPSGVAIANSKDYVTNSNFDDFFEPAGNGFITVINSETNEVLDLIEATRQGTGGITTIDDKLYVVNSGDIDFDLDTEEFLCDFDSPPSIDVINPENDTIETTIPITLSEQNPLVCSPGGIEPTPDGRFGYIGLGFVGALLKVDLENNTIVNGPSNPIIVTDLSGLNFTADVEIRNDGLGFTTLFNTDQIAVIDTANDELSPFPFIAPFPAGLRADDPNSQFFDGVQSLAIRTDGNFPDVFFITGLSNQLGSIDSSLILPPD